MPYALVTFNQTLFDKYQATVTAWDNIQEDATWLQEFADELRAIANSAWDNVMVNNWTLDNITVSFIEGDHISYSVDVSFTDGDLLGNDLAAGMPASSCLLASYGYIGAKPNRGRSYFAGFSENAQSNGEWDSTSLDAILLLTQAWQYGVTVDGINASLQIARRPSAVFPAYEFNPVQTIKVTPSTRAQRRRNKNQ